MTLLTTTSSRITARPFCGEEDFWRVRNLLIETQSITPTGFNWEIRRWEGLYFHHEQLEPDCNQQIRLWETDRGRLVGAVHPEGVGEAFLELHPDYRHIEVEMIAWAEENLSATIGEGHPYRLDFSLLDYDSPRRRLLEQRGYQITPHTFVIRRMRFGEKSLPIVMMPHGYKLCTTSAHDYQCVADILNAAFNRTTHTAAEFRNFATFAPSFRHDLNLVAEAPDGTFAALVGVTYDEINRSGVIEPVCTHPDHRRKGLARALISEGMRRVRALGAAHVYVGTGDDVAANALYENVGFTEAYRGSIWRKTF